MGGPRAIKAIWAPLPQMRIVPVGGVNLDNATEFIRMWAAALGVGGSLINQKLLDKGNPAELTEKAATFVRAVAQGRTEH
jgi:2-dehydro-3-deoxyphosphogluconate aldolase/(4S)-4-hydroxy-2-oxoglutarate aldolase